MSRKCGGVSIVRADLQERLVCVRIVDGIVESIDSSRPDRSDEVIDARGAALLPGLHDHHLHLAALGASLSSVDLSASWRTSAEVSAALRSASGVGWVRAVGYHESVIGPLDRYALDAIVADRPVRVQHRSGVEWVLNSQAVEMVQLDGIRHPGVERDDHDRPTGRVRGLDTQLRSRWSEGSLDLAPVGALLAGFGVTGVTDATPYESIDDVMVLAGAVPQRVMVMGAPPLDVSRVPHGLQVGPAKIVVGDHALPTVDELVAAMRVARRKERAVAVHCVTRVALILALAAWDEVGSREGDRIEHGAIIDAELAARVHELGLVVVTQPNFVAERGDRYLDEVDPADLDHLYPCGSLLAAGTRVGGSTDAPFGRPDPWAAMRAAVARVAPDGRPVGPHERIGARAAMDLFLSSPESPGGPVRRVAIGHAADLCVLDRPLAAALGSLQPSVVVTMVGGRIVHRDPR